MLQNCDYAMEDLRLLSMMWNMIPHGWYQNIRNISGKPDIIAITVLAEIFGWLCSSKSQKSKLWKVSYQYFEEKFGFTGLQLKYAFDCLENQGLISRAELNHSCNDCSVFHINLNLSKIKKISFIDGTKQVFSYSQDLEKTFFSKGSKTSYSKRFEDFLPLEEIFYNQICAKAGKNYPRDFVSKLLKKLTLQFCKHKFYQDEEFVSYMAKMLEFEMISDLEKDKTIEKYLNEVRNSKKTDYVSIIKRRIAFVFTSEKAYLILSNFYFENVPDRNKYCIWRYKVSDTLSFTKWEKSFLLKLIRNVFGNEVDSIEIREEVDE